MDLANVNPVKETRRWSIGKTIPNENLMKQPTDFSATIEGIRIDEKDMYQENERQSVTNKRDKTALYLQSGTLTYIKRALTSSTLHRLGSVAQNESLLLQFILGAVFLTSASFCVFYIVKAILFYAQYHVLTVGMINYEIPAEFPTIQFCNLNPFDEYSNSEIIQPLVNDGSINISNYGAPSGYVSAMGNYIRTKLVAGGLLGKFNILDMSFDITQMLISCRFMDATCTANDFFQYYDYYFGFCYRFNQGADLNGNLRNISMVGIAGPRYGLQLELYAGYAGGQELYMLSRGFRFTIFNKSAVDQYARKQGIDVGTGIQTNIEVHRTVTSHLPAPYGPCLPSEISEIDWSQNEHLQFMYDHYIDGSYHIGLPNPITGQNTSNWNWTVVYTQFFCLKTCFQKHVWEKCQCYDITLPHTPKKQDLYAANACANATQINCFNTQTQVFYHNPDLYGLCYTDCPYECYHVDFDLRINTVTYPTQYFANLLARSSSFNAVVNRYVNANGHANISYIGNFSELRDSIAKIQIYYDDLSYYQIDETPAMSFDDFLGIFGGTLGLFLGASLLTFTEILELGFLIVQAQIKNLLFRLFVKNK